MTVAILVSVLVGLVAWLGSLWWVSRVLQRGFKSVERMADSIDLIAETLSKNCERWDH